MRGKLSIFGGASDKGMISDSGLALYEPAEADRRPDMFLPADAGNPNQPTWQRLRTDFPYIALRFSNLASLRAINQGTPYKITNLDTGQWVVGFLVDWGPAESTGRIIDVSPCIARALRVETDDMVSVAVL